MQPFIYFITVSAVKNANSARLSWPSNGSADIFSQPQRVFRIMVKWILNKECLRTGLESYVSRGKRQELVSMTTNRWVMKSLNHRIRYQYLKTNSTPLNQVTSNIHVSVAQINCSFCETLCDYSNVERTLHDFWSKLRYLFWWTDTDMVMLPC